MKHPGERKCVCMECTVGVINRDKVPRCWSCANWVCTPHQPCAWRARRAILLAEIEAQEEQGK